MGSYGSDTSSASTNHSANSSPLTEKVADDAREGRDQETPSFVKLDFTTAKTQARTELKSIVEAEEEMLAIWH